MTPQKSSNFSNAFATCKTKPCRTIHSWIWNSYCLYYIQHLLKLHSIRSLKSWKHWLHNLKILKSIWTHCNNEQKLSLWQKQHWVLPKDIELERNMKPLLLKYKQQQAQNPTKRNG